MPIHLAQTISNNARTLECDHNKGQNVRFFGDSRLMKNSCLEKNSSEVGRGSTPLMSIYRDRTRISYVRSFRRLRVEVSSFLLGEVSLQGPRCCS